MELSIVLVIIGLIVGGILAGRDLIRTSELQSVITDMQKYVTAVNTFQGKYNGIPGDMRNATNYWGTDPDGCPSTGTLVLKQATCNGNGNFLIENDGAGNSGSDNTEHYRAWQQLASAGLIQGSYTGQSGPYSYASDLVGINVPASRISNAGFDWGMFTAIAQISASFWSAQYNTQYLFFGAGGAGVWDLTAPVLKPAEALAIDKKTDDGLPDMGIVLGSVLYDSTGSCVTTTGGGPSTYTYNLTTETIHCNLAFVVKRW